MSRPTSGKHLAISFVQRLACLFPISLQEALPTVAEHDVEETDDQPMLVIPPDGGYGWVIVAASFLANMMVDGIAYAFGILLIELVSYFEEGKAKVSLVGSLLCGVYLGTGKIRDLKVLCSKS